MLEKHSMQTAAYIAVVALTLLLAPMAMADNPGGHHMAIGKHGFSPAELTIPAGKRVKIMVHNKTTLPAEFESYDFSVEKVIPGGSTVAVYIGPLKKGRYKFFNDFAQKVSGRLTVR